MFKFVVLAAFIPAIFAGTPVRQCAGGLPLPDEVFFNSRTNPCNTETCDVSRSQGWAATYVDFTPTINTQSIMPRVRATVFGVTFVQELPAEITNNPCGILESPHTCPLTANRQVSYRLQLPVDPTTPSITSETEITLFGDNDQVIFCYRVGNRIVA